MITAKIDCVVKDKKGFIAYVQYFDGDKLIDTGNYHYNPENETAFKEKTGAKMLNLAESLDIVRIKAAAALADVVTKKQAEISAMQVPIIKEVITK